MPADDQRHRDGMIPEELPAGGREQRRRDGEIPEASLVRDHEQRDLGLRPLLLALASIAALVLLASLAMWLLFDALAARQGRLRVAAPPSAAAPPPRASLEVDSGELLEQLRAEEDALLGSYGWIDRERGRVRIPIERAMAIVAEEAR